MPKPELWAGIECSVNRVGDEYFDEIEQTGHGHRAGDLELFSSLGIRTMRYPVLWERAAPDRPDSFDWRWPDDRLARLRSLGIRPVVGLLHHGSGPRYTSLVDGGFPEAFASYAAAVARRYPWIDMYTPINEPLTTARFSGLYGLWYPHARDDHSFVRALLNQCRAIVLAMRRIREVNGTAQLIQTEDLGRIFSTRRLAYQAEFENERRWLTWDLLSGRVDRDHPLYGYLRASGATDLELAAFLDDPAPPQLVGINHYLTSERFLDHRLGRYPASSHGGNGREAYADVEAIRVCARRSAGHRGVLREAWERYRVPVALTELHLGCTRGEQLRWFRDGWAAACSLADEGVDIRAVTAWSALGAYGWNSLRVRGGGVYEPGVFDIRAPRPRRTALATLLTAIAAGGVPDHPVLDTAGWWDRSERWLYPRRRPPQFPGAPGRRVRSTGDARLILITGATGSLGRAFARICRERGLAHRITSRAELDIADERAVALALESRAWAIVNTAGYVRVDEAERDRERCFRENVDGPAVLADQCELHGVRLVTFSSDLVFDGNRTSPYLESDAPDPLGVYGASKAAAERRVLDLHPSALVIRTSAFFGPWDEHNFLTKGLSAIEAGEHWSVHHHSDVVSPTYLPDLVNASLDLLIDGEEGIWHLANAGAISWLEFARLAARELELPEGLLHPECGDRDAARRPAFSALSSERGQLLPPLPDALHRYLRACGNRLPVPAGAVG